MRALSLAALLLVLASGAAYGNPGPYPEHCIVMPPDGMAAPRLVGVPSDDVATPAADLEITIRDLNDVPIPNVFIEVTLNSTCIDPDPLCVCLAGVFTGITNAEGFLRLTMDFGGCCRDANSAVIRANAVPIRVYNVLVSPDYDGIRGDCEVGLADFVYFASGYTQVGVPCRSFDGDAADACGLNDFVVFAGAYTRWCNGD